MKITVAAQVSEDAREAVEFLRGVRIFMTSREQVKQPEGTDLFDKSIDAIQAALENRHGK